MQAFYCISVLPVRYLGVVGRLLPRMVRTEVTYSMQRGRCGGFLMVPLTCLLPLWGWLECYAHTIDWRTSTCWAQGSLTSHMTTCYPEKECLLQESQAEAVRLFMIWLWKSQNIILSLYSPNTLLKLAQIQGEGGMVGSVWDACTGRGEADASTITTVPKSWPLWPTPNSPSPNDDSWKEILKRLQFVAAMILNFFKFRSEISLCMFDS